MTNYKKITEQDIHFFTSCCGVENVLTDSENCQKYGQDHTEDLMYPPQVVVKPVQTEQVAALLSYCNQHNITVTPRGAGTGLSGGALPIYGGLLISMEKFNRIIDIDKKNLQVTVEPGVINQVLQEELAQFSLFYPPDPASKGSCYLGGNIAHCSGGPRAVKYGVTRDYVLNLEVVLPNGKIIWTGANTLKNSTGYSLTHLMIGSEGTLGIVTKIVFKLIPLPQHNVLLLVPFYSAEKACEAVAQVFYSGIIPSAMEFMERDAIDWVLKYIEHISIPVEDRVQAHLLIELDGNNLEQLMLEAEKLTEVLSCFECGEILFAENEAQKENLWHMRRNVAVAVKNNSVYKEEDTVVKRAELPTLLRGVKQIGKKYGFQSVCYGHAGDGNLHINIIKGSLSDDEWNNKVPLGIKEIFELCVKLGGTISGEHGIGLVQKKYLPIVQSQIQIELQKGIKKVFDPNNILNPGKIF